MHLGKLILRSKKLFKSFTQRAELVLSLGGTVLLNGQDSTPVGTDLML